MHHIQINCKQHMWQSRVEIERYSVTYFNYIIVFKVLVTQNFEHGNAVKIRNGSRYLCIYGAHMSPTLNDSSSL